MPAGMQGSKYKGPPLLSVLGYSIFQIVPQFWLTVLVPLHSSLPGASESFLFQFFFWCPMVSHGCDVVEFSSKYMCNTSPSPSHEYGFCALLMILSK